MWRRGILTSLLNANGRSVFRRQNASLHRRMIPGGVHSSLSFPPSRSVTTDEASSSSAPEEADSSRIGSIYNPPPYSVEPEELANLIRCSLVGASTANQAEASKDTGMGLVFLGTSAGLPTKGRGPTSTLLKLGGESFLVDVGEGVQRQLTFIRAKPSHIDRIFITHLHGDHIFGLPGLLLGLQHSQQLRSHESNKHTTDGKTGKGRIRKRSVRRIEERVVKIYGPPGLYNYIAANVILSCTLIHSLNIQVYELVGGRVRRAHGARDIRNPFEANYPEFNFGRLTRHQIPRNPDGVWVIQDVSPVVTREDILSKNGGSNRNSNTNQRRFRIQAAEVDHLSGVATFGYTIQEEEPPRNIDAAKAKELGVSHGCHKYNLLKAGFSVLSDDGTKEVQPQQVLTARRKKARKITLVGDNREWTPSMKRIAQNSDVLVHEATLMDKEGDWRVSCCW
jgi:ribonuclease BN (tRNA processing enzyme)